MNPQTTQTAQEKAQELLALEQELVLSSFSNEDALNIGLQAIAYIHEAKKSGVYIEIRRGEILFFPTVWMVPTGIIAFLRRGN